ncbi:hypothetical protein HF872_12490 [Megasphaera hexanoica]|uniref:Uncharacterized protein n=1 Tax=Megasphaera hexanoica TaxID=1675036 RepID=A0A848C4H8_9FIRM|nr:ESPR-type extended signal peptide-containing protein [Megasphaera hexanoica]NME29423.1 hypothetical protein [Megasphaera hexanoica]
MNKIFKVIYSKTKHCYVVVSELTKSHCKSTQCNTAKSKTALTAAVLLALGAFSFVGMPVVQAADGTESLRNNDFVGANDQYWYYDEKKGEWTTYQYKLTSAFNNRARGDLPNYQGGGAKFPGAVTAGLYAQAGQQTVTIGDRNAGQSKGSVFIGEHSGYNNGDNAPAGMKNNYVTSVGFQSDATGWGSIAIGSNAKAENSKMESQVVKEVGKANTSGTVSDDTYGIEENPTIQGASVALGYNAHSKDGNIAIGSYSDATSTDKNDSYVSVGNANLKRRITNVADGASASDVATVGQLQALSDKVGVYDAGFGIKIASDKDNKTNTISLNRNLGTNYTDKAHHGDEKVTVAVDDTGLVLGGYAEDEKGNKKNPAVTYGATGDDSVTVGGMNSLASGKGSVVTGGVENIASGATAVAIGGNNNDAIGTRSAVLGGLDNTAFGNNSMVSGGSYNVAGGIQSAVLGGFSNYALGTGTTSIGGYGKDYETGYDSSVNGDYSVGVAGGSTGKDAKYALAAGHQAVVTKENGTAIGYQATTDEAKTIAFGHDAGDVSGYTIEWNKLPENQVNADGTTNDYTKAPKSVTPTTYKDAYYNRLVKVADGVNDHDVVVMEQLTKATNDLTKDLSVNAGWGINVADEKDTTGKVTKNVISLNRNLGTNYGNPWKGEGKVTFEAGGENSMILGGAASILFNNEEDNVKAGAYGKDSVLVGGFNNLIDTVANDVTQTGEDAVIVGGDTNTVTGLRSVIVGGSQNKVSGGHSIVIGGASNETDGGGAGVFGGQLNKAAGEYSSVLGGDHNEADGDWSSAIGGTTNIASGRYATVLGGVSNDAKGNESVVVGGGQNVAIGEDSTVNGGADNTSYGSSSYAAGGMKNMAFGNASVALGGKDSSVNGKASTGIAGGSTGENAIFTLAAGYQSVVADSGVEWRPITQDEADKINQGINSWPGYSGVMDYGEDYSVKVLDRISTAVGYQSTADAPGVIAFGHDKGDVASVAKKWKQKATEKDGKYYDANDKEISYEDYYKLANADGTWNDYTQDPIGTENITYQSAYYNRLVKAADGIDAHDAVVMEQLKPYTKSDASNIGANLKTYTVGDDGETITETDATEDQKKANKVAWGKALGADTFSEGTPEKATDASTSDQLVTGKTLYNYDAPVAETGKTLNYVSANNTTGQNLSALDAQVKANADKGLKFAANSGAEYTAKLGSTVKIQGTAKKENHEYTADNLTTEIDENGNITILMDKDMSVEKLAVNGKDGKDGAPGTPGSIGINGRDGQSGVGIDGKDGISIKGKDGKDGVTMKAVDGKDGTEGHIGLTGPAGTNGIKGADGQPGTSIDITVKNGYDGKAGTDGKDGVKGEKGVDGTSLTRIVYKDGAGEHQVATMEDGLKFKGDDGTEIAKKLNNTLDIIGGADSNNLTEGNIGVNSTDKGQLKVQLAKDLTGITSISNQKTEGGKTTGAKITLGTDGNVDVNGGKITKVGSGIEKDATGNITEASKTNAANIGDVQTIAESTATSLTGKGLKFAANSGAEYTAKLGSKVTIQGTAKKEGHEYTADNLTTEIDGNGNITILMDKDMSVEKLAVNGKDGKDGAPGSIGINGRDGKSGIGIDGKDGISIKGRDGKDGVTMKAVDGENGTEGHISLTGPAGTNGIKGADGQPGTSIDITVKNGYDGKAGTDGKDGVKGEKGVDGTSLTRIVYTDGAGEHQVATMEDGLKFKGDDTTVINKKLNSTLDIIGGAKGDLTEGNIGVNNDSGKLKVQLAKDLTGITSISNQKTTKVDGKDVTTGAKITLGADGTTTISGGDVNVSGNKITHVGSGIETDANGKYTVTDQNKGNAANIGDVQNMVNDAKTELISGDNGLNNKANIDASNIGANLKDEDGKTPASDAKKTANENAWGKAIGTGEIEANNGQLVTGNTVYNEVRPKEDGNYVKTNQTTGANLSALDSKIGKLDDDGNYIKKDDSISKNLSTLDAQVKTNADNIANNTKSIQNITNSVKNLSDNAVQYDKDSNKTKVTLGGEGGTTITNVKDGALSEKSSDAVNGKQLYNEQKAREAADKDITEKVTNNTNEITKIKNGDFTDASKTAIHNIAKDAVKVVDGKNTTVTKVDGTDTTPTTYAVNVEGTGKVASGDTGLISGDTLYKEVHVDSDGSYIKSNNTVGQNLSALDSGLKTTSDLIHTNAKGDTIQIGGNSTATKIDVSGKDKDGNTTGRVITGVMTDGKDLTSAANVGYVNGITSANTQQIYRDMNNAYSRLDTNINRAAAGSNALAALHPLDFDPADKASFAVGYGHYHNANAAAVGAFYQPNANTMVNMGISIGNGDPGFNAGVSFKIGKGSAYNGVSKAEMAQTIHDQAEEISAIKANDAAKDKRIDALEKENQEMKKQIQEILSRLNG